MMIKFDHDPESYYKDKQRYLAALNVSAYDDNIECRRDWAAVDRIMYNWERIARKIPVEMVNCRRKRKITDEYKKLVKDYNSYKEELEQAITMFTLIHH